MTNVKNIFVKMKIDNKIIFAKTNMPSVRRIVHLTNEDWYCISSVEDAIT